MSEGQHRAILDALARGDIDIAEALCEEFLRSGGGAEGLYLAGVIRSLRGDKAGAVTLMERASKLLPKRADIAYNHGVVLREAGRVAEAADAWRRALAADPEHRDAQANLALALDQLGDPAAAMTGYRRLLDRWPDDRDALYNLGNLSQRRGDAVAAANAYAALLAKHPAFVPGWINSGMLKKRLHDYDGAEACYRAAIAVDPGSAGAHFNLANLLLMCGRWAEGFAEYEWRLRLPGESRPDFGLPEWTGYEPRGARVLLWGDQGHGDSIQFLRFARLVAARGHRPFVIVKPELRTLAATAPGVAMACAPGEPVPVADAQLALASLPLKLGIDAPARFWTGPYLRVDSEAVISGSQPGRIGLVWAGDPRHPNDANRSAKLTELAPLLEVPGVAWVSLQQGPAREQIANSPWAGRIVDLGPRLTDFATTAAVVDELDCVVTVDTSVAHLVGAVGREAYVMLPEIDCDWRWLVAGESTPWYPTLKLVRQERSGDWPAVARKLAATLSVKAK